MIANSHFTIGKAHEVCEDYARAGIIQRAKSDPRPNITMAVVADGCSSSPDSDWGARFLTQSAVALLSNLDWVTDSEGEVTLDSLDEKGAQIYERADGMRRTCEVSHLANDATLLVAYWAWESPNINVVAWGDGIVAARNRHTGVVEYHVIEFACNAPGYLSYTGNPARKALYLENTNEGEHTLTSFALDGNAGPTDWDQHHGLDPMVFKFPITDYDLVAVISDGAQTFQKPVDRGTGKGHAPIPLHSVIEQVMGIKNTSGDFVVRRVRNGFINRFCNQEGWTHYDDLGVGMVFVPEDAIPQEGTE